MRRLVLVGTMTVVGLGLGAAVPEAEAQGISASRRVQGPGGRAVERRVESYRAPGVAGRSVTITRPGGVYRRDLQAARAPGSLDRSASISRPGGAEVRRELSAVRGEAIPPGGRIGAPRGYGYGFEPGFRPRPVGPRWGVGFGPAISLAAPAFYFSFNSPPPPPPVFVEERVIVEPFPVVIPPPVVVEEEYIEFEPEPPPPPPTVVVREPRRYRPETIVVDPVANALDRLGSDHDNSRRDGALTLGRLGDARAVPALVDLLRYDEAHEVREAAAHALGAIGDPRALRQLAGSANADRRRNVRAAAASGYRRIESLPPVVVTTPILEDRSGSIPSDLDPLDPPPLPDDLIPEAEAIPAPPTRR